MATYYIGADVHSKSIEMAIMNRKKIVQRYTLPTSISAVAAILNSLSGKKYLAIEEGPMAGWLYRNLHRKVERFVVADPRRNKLISSDGDHDDKIDSAKLAMLFAGGYLREIYHSDDERRVELKHWVSLYHDRVHDAVRHINKIRARCRMHGVTIPRKVVRQPEHRDAWLRHLKHPALAKQLLMLWIGYDATAKQARMAKQQLIQLSQKYAVIRRWKQLPGIGTIRAVTIFAYLDTPWRFKRKNKLWKYCGVGLQRTASGTDKKGKPKPALLQLPRATNRILKNAVLGAALSAINQKQNTFRKDYERMVRNGLIPCNARHTVARKLLSVMWGMWKINGSFDPKNAAFSEPIQESNCILS
jgi:transposase